MNGTDVITTARLNFGEITALTLSDDELLKWLNKAIQEVYVSLPPDELRGTIQTTSIDFTNGRYAIPAAWDKVLTVKDETGAWELHEVSPPVIQGMREMGDFFKPSMGVWAQLGNVLLVYPFTENSFEVSYTTEPSAIATGQLGTEITAVPKRFHTALVNLVTAYAYAQEEDVAQSQYYRGLAYQNIAARGVVMDPEAQ